MASDAELLALLREERARRPDLAGTLDLHMALLEARGGMVARVPESWVEAARDRLNAGLPALDLDHLDCDWGAVAALARTICEITARHRPELAEPLARVAARFGPPAGDPPTGGPPSGGPPSVGPGAAGHGAASPPAADPRATGPPAASPHAAGLLAADGPDEAIFSFVLNQALHPFLRAYAAEAAGLLGARQWSGASCPLCGGAPDLAALEGEGGERRLLCARCDHEWRFPRLGCPFCGNDDPATLGYFPAGAGGYRVSVCERCHRYLKTVDRRELWEGKPLTLERILTVGLDVAATGHGYRAA